MKHEAAKTIAYDHSSDRWKAQTLFSHGSWVLRGHTFTVNGRDLCVS
jgi:hypothetical protein